MLRRTQEEPIEDGQGQMEVEGEEERHEECQHGREEEENGTPGHEYHDTRGLGGPDEPQDGPIGAQGGPNEAQDGSLGA